MIILLLWFTVSHKDENEPYLKMTPWLLLRLGSSCLKDWKAEMTLPRLLAVILYIQRLCYQMPHKVWHEGKDFLWLGLAVISPLAGSRFLLQLPGCPEWRGGNRFSTWPPHVLMAASVPFSSFFSMQGCCSRPALVLASSMCSVELSWGYSG
jgi:hypothetical protein